MKKIAKIIGSVLLTCGILFSACSDMLEVNSDRYLSTDDNDLASPNDSVYSLWGILQQLRGIADRYVILGELRADLVDVTEYSDQNIRDINDINYRLDNPYLSTKEYFAVINNCNYYLSKVDPNSTEEGNETMRREYVAIKAIRAWTYWQLGLNYGDVPYIEKPILTVEDMNADYPMLSPMELAATLIEDLTPYEAVPYPDHTVYGSAMGNPYPISASLIPIPFLLGDLHLWLGNEEQAATYYHQLIAGDVRPDFIRMPYSSDQFNNGYVVWIGNPALGEFNIIAMNWGLSGEVYSTIAENRDNRSVMNIYNLCAVKTPITPEEFLYALKPSQAAMDTWANEIYFYPLETNTVDYEELIGYGGDLRGAMGPEGSLASGAYGEFNMDNDTIPFIAKYFSLNNSGLNKTYIYRHATLYLRLAEAVNRAGYPAVALAALKYGLSDSILIKPRYNVNLDPNHIPPYLNFDFIPLAQRETVRGLHARGSGDVARDTVHYVFDPARHLTLNDSIAFVEELLLKEYALEMAFEGNRFHDLMRFAIINNDPSILADRVRLKNPTAAAKLANPKNWYIPADFTLPAPPEENPEEGGEQPAE